ncbi:unnamed protein product [Sphagnum jensenii]|uniref:Phytanoyl-CoA dioxygenase n=1 Tax=Sphagnum jensenii TaxID=128206 RepID=A0ABP1BPS0_9BRYO
MGAQKGLSEEQKSFFESEGYLIIPDFASDEECTTLISRMDELLEAFDPAAISIFSTKNQKKYMDKYFDDSASNISFFFEEKAHDGEGRLKQPKKLSINKVGHALHDLDPDFRSFSRSDKVLAVVSSLNYKRPAPIQSMYIFKQPGIGGEVVPHQDNTFLYSEPLSCVGLWVALEDATVENGCLWVLPKSHKLGLARRFLKDSSGVRFDNEPGTYDKNEFIPVEVKAGSLVLLDGNLVHQSFENTSPKSRQAYSVHVVETKDCIWAEQNWLQRRADFPLEPLFSRKEASDISAV